MILYLDLLQRFVAGNPILIKVGSGTHVKAYAELCIGQSCFDVPVLLLSKNRLNCVITDAWELNFFVIMSLSILATQFELQEKTFKSIAFASLRARLNFYTLDISLKNDFTIKIWIRRFFGPGEDEYEVFSMDIHEESRVSNFNSKISYKTEDCYTLGGTDNTPSKL